MPRRIVSVLFGAALVVSGLAGPGAAQTEVPAEVQIEDPAEDANYLNDQGLGPPIGPQGDNPGGVYWGAGDILKVWWTNDADNISAHIQTTSPPPATSAFFYRIYTNPSEDTPLGCLRWIALVHGERQGVPTTYHGPDYAELEDACTEGAEDVEAELTIETLADETGILTITLPRSANAAFADGGVIAAPVATTRHAFGAEGAPRTLVFPQTDNTKPGTDYTITSGDDASSEDENADKEKSKKGNKGKKKGNKGKKKGKGPRGKPACAAYTPGEQGAEAETVVVTDKATEEKPVEQAVTLDASVADFVPVADPSSDYFNIQVDSGAAQAGLYAYIEFPTRRDYDLNLLHPDGSYAARSRGFNPVVGTPAESHASESGHGGEPSDHSEKLVGIATSDCGGWTLETQNWFGEGGEFTVRLWLGDVATEPQPPGEEKPQ